MKDIKKLIIILFVIVVCILLLINIINKNDDNTPVSNDLTAEVSNNDTLETVTDYKDFYTVNQCVSTYLSYLNTKRSSYYGYNSKNEIGLIVEDNQIKQNIMDFLDKEYIQRNNITLDNLYNTVKTIEDATLFVATDMKVIPNSSVDKYVVEGIATDLSNVQIMELKLIINLDKNNNTFSVEPIKENTQIKNNKTPIEKNENNQFKYVEGIDEEYISKEYIKTFKRLVLANPELSYNYLEKDYRDKRFGSVEEYKKYVKYNKQNLISLQCDKYLKTEYNGYTQYACLDKYENYYIFDAISPTDYTVKLDIYSIESDKFIDEYNKSNIKGKVELNIDKFIKMINNKDYKNSYEVLYDQFKTNNFSTEEKYIEYIQKNLYEYNRVLLDQFENEGETYIYKIIIYDKTEKETKAKRMTVVMKLEEGTDFVMSFSME